MAVETVPRAELAPPAPRYVKRGRFRKAVPEPAHEQAARDLLSSLSVDGLQPTTVRELLCTMADRLNTWSWHARHTPEKLIGDPWVYRSWTLHHVAQAKALLYATRHDDGAASPARGEPLSLDTPVPAPLVLDEDDFRARVLALIDSAGLSFALTPVLRDSITEAALERMRDAVSALHRDLVRAGVVCDQAPVVRYCDSRKREVPSGDE